MSELPEERGGMTKAHSDALHALSEGFGGFAITAYDMAGCPKQMIDPNHYRWDDERTCRCDELAAALSALSEAEAAFALDPARRRHDLAEARFQARSCGADWDAL